MDVEEREWRNADERRECINLKMAETVVMKVRARSPRLGLELVICNIFDVSLPCLGNKTHCKPEF